MIGVRMRHDQSGDLLPCQRTRKHRVPGRLGLVGADTPHSNAGPGDSTVLTGSAGVALTFVYAAYQWRHAMRVLPVRPRLDYVLGLLAAAFVVLTLGSGLALALPWWRSRGLRALPAYPTRVMALHIIGCMLVLTFVAAHLGAVLKRDRSEG